MAGLPSGTVTFLFTDLEGSTSLWDRESEQMRTALARHDELLRQAVEAHAGHVVKTTGDGLHAVFEVAEAAVTAAVDAQRSIIEEAWPSQVPIRVRMGLNTGSAELRDDDYYGPALNRGARVMAVAHGGQILVSQATADLVRDALAAEVSLEDLGDHQLRDLARPERLFQVHARGLAAGFPPLRSLSALPGNLPTQLTSFVEREVELQESTRLLAEARLVTIIGVGGVGKTRLAAQAAAEALPTFPDGAWFGELAAADSPDSLAEVVASTLGVRARAGLSLADSIVEYLRPKRLLLVLDNCEHLLDAAGRLVVPILRQCPGVQVLATSREGLGVPGERMWALRSLALPSAGSSRDDVVASEAVRLFVERARAARPAFELGDANAVPVAEICRRLDGVPLAIELAAARLASMNPDDIAARLDERFRLLTGGRHAAVGRQQTLLETVEWSFSLLGARERLVFDRIGVFAGGFDPTAAQAIVTDDRLADWDVLDALGELVAKCMLGVDDSVIGSVRYQLLETLREYSRGRMEETGDPDVWRRRHAEYYEGFAWRVREGVTGPAEPEWTNRFETEVDNLRTAVGWALDSGRADDVQIGLRIIGALWSISTANGSTKIGPWAERALGQLDEVDAALASAVLGVAAMHAFYRGDIDAMRERAEESLRRGPSPPWTHSLGHVAMALHHTMEGDTRRAVEIWLAANAVSADEPPALRAAVHGGCSQFAVFAGDEELARTQADLALSLARESGSPSALAQALVGITYAYRDTDPTMAKDASEEALKLMGSGTGRVLLIPALGLAARLRGRAGDEAGSFRALVEAAIEARDNGDRPSLVSLLNRAAVPTLVDLGHDESAAVLAGAATEGPLSGLSLVGADVDDRAAAMTILQHRMPAPAYQSLIARGASMSYDEVVEYLLTGLRRLLGAEAPA